MKITKEQIAPTKVKLTVVSDEKELAGIKKHVLGHLKGNVKVPGFRAGKAPEHLIEKQLDPATLQSEFLEHGINDLFFEAAQTEKLRAVGSPEINITKFVPYTTLEFTAEVEVIGAIKLPDYKKIKLAPTKPTVTAKDVDEVIDNLRERAAEKVKVERAAKTGDETIIDFRGVDTKTQEFIPGTDGTEYPLTLGSNSFIPGFEEEVVGLKEGDEKTFTITFPEDYGTKDLQKRKVDFTVKLHAVNEVAKAKLDDDFASKVGPFKTVAELKDDIKKQLLAEKEREAASDYDNELMAKIADQTEVELPKSLVDEEITRMEDQEKQNSAYRGQTWQEHLDSENVTAEEHFEKNRPAAEMRVKAGLILAEVSEKEGITVTPEELEIRIMILKNQYADQGMQTELDKSENRRDIQSRLMTEKTLDKLKTYATKS